MSFLAALIDVWLDLRPLLLIIRIELRQLEHISLPGILDFVLLDLFSEMVRPAVFLQ